MVPMSLGPSTKSRLIWPMVKAFVRVLVLTNKRTLNLFGFRSWSLWKVCFVIPWSLVVLLGEQRYGSCRILLKGRLRCKHRALTMADTEVSQNQPWDRCRGDLVIVTAEPSAGPVLELPRPWYFHRISREGPQNHTLRVRGPKKLSRALKSM